MWDRSQTSGDEPASSPAAQGESSDQSVASKPFDASTARPSSAAERLATPTQRPTAPSAPPFDSVSPPAVPLAPAAPTARPAPAAPIVQPPRQPLASPTPFSSIGSAPAAPHVPPAPAPAAPTFRGTPAAPVSAAGAIARTDSPATVQPQKRRRWPLALLALFTIVGSGALSWAVATYVNDNDVAAVPEVESADSDPGATAQPAVADPAEPTAPSATSQSTSARALADEPFAEAAEIIRPSVVQLNLGSGLGTGVIIDEDGTILTAAHVVGTNTDVRVTFSDGSSAPGTVVGTHVPTDVAVVKVDPAGRNLVPATLADGDQVRVGQLAVAVGSPFGFDQTVTAGIISAVDRIVNGVSMVQTDAPINPGNSGGPLINLSGEVVGINDLIFTESGSSAGVGFAISIDLAVIIADQIIAGVEPQVALLGVSTAPPANGARGAQVAQVVPGSAAEAAGLEVGDIVVDLNGVATRGTGDLRAQVIDQPPGSTITLTVLRGSEEITLEAVLGQTQ